MQNCLAIDVAKGKSMVTLVSSSGEVLIDPYEINHSINDFSNLLNRINNISDEGELDSDKFEEYNNRFNVC